MTDKQAMDRWAAVVKDIMESTPTTANESREERSIRIKKLEADPEDWFNYYFPRYTYAPPAAFHREATNRILINKEWFEVRIWSRELAKSTRTMMEILYLTLVGHLTAEGAVIAHQTAEERAPPAHESRKRYVLLISNSLDNATRLLMPYKANLECNNRIINDYGLQQNAGKWQAEEFTTLAGVAFRALGAGQSPRGSRNEDVRPDVLLFDDIDTDADCLNPQVISHKWNWIEGAAIGTRSISRGTTIIFCGNRIAADCSIERAAKLADHVSEVNIRNENGASSWPQKNSETDIDRVLSQKSYAATQKEYFNNPVTEGAVFSRMAYKPALPAREYDLLVCYTDPSYKTTSDYKATVLVGKKNFEYHIIKCYLEHATTAEMINWHYRIMDIVGNANCYYLMEEVFMQDVLVKEVSDAGKRSGRNIPIRGDTRRKPDKFMRIESLLEPLHRNGELFLNEYERNNPHMQRLDEQFINFAPGSRAHDDGPDAVEGAIWIIADKLCQHSSSGIKVYSKPANSKAW